MRHLAAKEVGSFKGGSALRICEALECRAVLLCIDTFLGDASMWLKGQLTLRKGHPELYAQRSAQKTS